MEEWKGESFEKEKLDRRKEYADKTIVAVQVNEE